MDKPLHPLHARARALAGRTLSEIAGELGRPVPENLSRHKGWVGQLIEAALGASAGSRPVPDFPEYGVELKTLPVDAAGRPRESTFVCSIALPSIADTPFEASGVFHKLSKVLWVPVEAERSVPLAARRVGSAVLWSPSDAEWQVLRHDWQELAGRLALGEAEHITAHLGVALQVRPKAARGSCRRTAHDADGAPVRVQPKGFYLRTRFTAQILQQAFGAP